MVPAIYQGLSPALPAPPALSVFAHLEDLVARGIVSTDGPADARGRTAGVAQPLPTSAD